MDFFKAILGKAARMLEAIKGARRERRMDYVGEMQGTIMARVLETMEKGVFAEAPTESVAENETTIGKLTSYEKALYTVRNAIAKENNALAEKADIIDLPAAKKILSRNRQEHKILDKLFWDSVEVRIGEAAQKEGLIIGIRSGYEVVSFNPLEGLSNLLGLLEALSGPLEMHNPPSSYSHNCAKCSAYDDCTLPFKKPR
ncbi:MAG: hypothetical protein PHE24_04110 [Patescibacteria group bacterium]|nr:hypothetical protein [Patescibacteria group bacterium]